MSHTFVIEMDKKKQKTGHLPEWRDDHQNMGQFKLMLAAVSAISHSQLIREEQVTLSQIILRRYSFISVVADPSVTYKTTQP